MERCYGSDRERSIHKADPNVKLAWDKFKQYLVVKNPDLNIDVVLRKLPLKKDPVVSYGIIEFVIQPKSVLYHVYRRRNTLEYDILIKGFATKSQLFDMVCLLSRDERDRILNNEWQAIWDDYWVDHNEGGYHRLGSQSERRFEEIKEVTKLIDQYVECKIPTRSYIFPKGKPNKNETGLEAALREAKEETKNTFNHGEMYFESPLVQNYVGSDDRSYTDYYYVWQQPTIYNSPVQKLSTIKYFRTDGVYEEPLSFDQPFSRGNKSNEDTKVIREETPRLRDRTISHELESDAWLEIPIFDTTREKLEWQQGIEPYRDFGVFSRHFAAILDVHGSI
jgi:hypothetical protein